MTVLRRRVLVLDFEVALDSHIVRNIVVTLFLFTNIVSNDYRIIE